MTQYINLHGNSFLSRVSLSAIPEAIQVTRYFYYNEWNTMYNWMKDHKKWPTADNVKRYIAGLMNYEEYRDLQKQKGLWETCEIDLVPLRASLMATSKKTKPREIRDRLSRGLGSVPYRAVSGTRDTEFDGPDCQPDSGDDPFARI